MATKAEIAKIITMLNSMYPNQKYEISTDNRTIVNQWHMFLGHYDYPVLEVAAMKAISESPFIPKVADINNQIKSMVRLASKSSADAWGDVRKAMDAYGWNRPTEAKALLDSLTLQIVESMGWQNLCSSENPEADRAHFLRLYEQGLHRQEEITMMPPAMRPMVSAIGQKILSTGGQYEAGKEINASTENHAGQARIESGQLAGCEE